MIILCIYELTNYLYMNEYNDIHFILVFIALIIVWFLNWYNYIRAENAESLLQFYLERIK